MRQFGRDKIMGCVVECTTEEECKELVDWYIREVNPEDEAWEAKARDIVFSETNCGILLEDWSWSYSEIMYYKSNHYKIIPFNEALLQTETKENLVQEQTETHLKLNDEISLSKEDFIKFAMEGYKFSFISYIYFYDDSFDNPFRMGDRGLQIHWININSKNKFKVVKSPYESEWKKYKCIKNGITYFVETNNLSGIGEYIQYDSIKEVIKEEN